MMPEQQEQCAPITKSEIRGIFLITIALALVMWWVYTHHDEMYKKPDLSGFVTIDWKAVSKQDSLRAIHLVDMYIRKYAFYNQQPDSAVVTICDSQLVVRTTVSCVADLQYFEGRFVFTELTPVKRLVFTEKDTTSDRFSKVSVAGE